MNKYEEMISEYKETIKGLYEKAINATGKFNVKINKNFKDCRVGNYKILNIDSFEYSLFQGGFLFACKADYEIMPPIRIEIMEDYERFKLIQYDLMGKYGMNEGEIDEIKQFQYMTQYGVDLGQYKGKIIPMSFREFMGRFAEQIMVKKSLPRRMMGYFK